MLENAPGTGGQGDMRRTCGTTAAAGKARAAKAGKVCACMPRTCVHEISKSTYIIRSIISFLPLFFSIFLVVVD
jgi:hypothetical protein